MKRPAFQFYADKWMSNAKLRMCSAAARGTWMDCLCLMHNSDEYGVLRFPLTDVANAIGAKVALLRELSTKRVLKGGDKDVDPYIFTPRHGGKDGRPVELLARSAGPMWYSSRQVRDEYIRLRSGGETRFKPGDPSPPPTPTPRHGDDEGTPQGTHRGSPPSGVPSQRHGMGASSTSTASKPYGVADGYGNAHAKVTPIGAKLLENQTLARWWDTVEGCVAEGHRYGIEAKPGEEMKAFKDRLFRLIEAAKRGSAAAS